LISKRVIKPYQFILIAMLLFVLDFSFTAYFISTESHLVSEANPLIYTFQGFFVLIINLVYLIIIYVTSRYVYRYNTINIVAENTIEYTKKLFLSDHHQFILISVFYAFIISTLVTRSFIIFEWLLFGILKETFFISPYYYLREIMPMRRFDVFVLGISFILCLIYWYNQQFKLSRLYFNHFKKTLFINIKS
jgi:hypothetical protein